MKTEESILHTREMAAFSKLLQMTMLDTAAFMRAVELGYIVVCDDGVLTWTLGSETLLAYFCGRLWSGDTGRYSRRCKAVVWVRGTRTFPAKELQLLFGMKTLRQLRQNRGGGLLPRNFELVDALFR